jgi:SagB-type dehydrogenase family enzyme
METKMNRRQFLGIAAAAAAGVTFGACSSDASPPAVRESVFIPVGTAATELKPLTLPEPRMSGGRPLLDTVKDRKSSRSFKPQPLPLDMLSSILWTAFGINRPESGYRTAPTAKNSQEIDLYVLLAAGTYLYNARAHRLEPVSAQDLRPLAGVVGFMKQAPLHLVYVADYAKVSKELFAQKELYSAAHTGFIGQNVYLFCASEGLGTVIHISIDRTALVKALNLRDDQGIVFAQVIGYPA